MPRWCKWMTCQVCCLISLSVSADQCFMSLVFYIILSASQNNSTYSWSCFSLSFLPSRLQELPKMWVREPCLARERQWLLRPEELWPLSRNHLAAKKSYCSLNCKANPWVKNNQWYFLGQSFRFRSHIAGNFNLFVKATKSQLSSVPQASLFWVSDLRKRWLQIN